MKLVAANLLIFVFKFISTTKINHEVYCPGEYQLIPSTKICILITQKATSYSNLCLSMGSTSTFYYLELILKRNLLIIDFLKRNNVTKFWLPVTKDDENVLIWNLPMPLWTQKIEEMNDVTAPKNYSAGHCAMYEANIKNMFMDDCQNEYPHVCFYDMIESVVVNTELCTNQLMGRESKFHGICLEIVEFNSNTTLNKSTVAVDSEQKFIMVSSLINALFWTTKTIAIALNSTDTDKRVSVIENGIVAYRNVSEVNYRMVEDKTAIITLNKLPSLYISYQDDSDAVTVEITYFEHLWNPMSNSTPLTCHYDINILDNTILNEFSRENTSGSTRLFKLNLPHYQGIGILWCESQRLLTFETITSNRLILKRNLDRSSIVICVYIERSYCETCNNIYSELKQIREFRNKFSHDIQDLMDFEVHDMQLKKIIPIGTNRTEYLFHIILETELTKYVVPFFKRELDNLNLNGYQITRVQKNDECQSLSDYFPNARLNEKSVITIFCLLDTGIPPSQLCVGNLINGAEWLHVYDIDELLLKCNRNLENDRTNELFNLNKMLRDLTHGKSSNRSEAHAMAEKTIAFINKSVTMEHMEITDVRYATETLNNLLETVPVDIFEEISHNNITVNNETKATTLLDSITNIIDTILNQETNSLNENESSKILDTIDLMAEKLAESNVSTWKPVQENITDENHDDDGVTLIQKKNYIVMIVNPLVANITGVALYKTDARIDENSFQDFTIRKLRSNDTVHSIYNESLEITAHIPADTFEKIKINRNGELVPPDRIIFKIYYKNSLLDENVTNDEHNGTTEIIESESKVIGITIPKYYERDVPPGIFTMFKTKEKLNNIRSGDELGCSDNLRTAKSREWNPDLWNYDKISTSIVVCPVKRLANIGFVKLFGNKIVTDETSPVLIQVFHYTTVVGCTLSLVGLILIFVTAIIYDDWKSREATALVLNVSLATFLQLTLFVIAESGLFKHGLYCLIIGGILHYVTLAGFFISLFVTNCQYRRYIIVFGSAKPKYFKTKILIFGWTTPLLIVAGCLIVTPDSYIPTKELHELGGICYPTSLILYLFVHVPIILIFCINVSVYICIIVRLTRENPNLRKTPKKSRVLMQIRLFFFIFFMLSLTWAFGLLAHYLEYLTFAYLFNVTGPLQGFCLFIFCVVIEDRTRTFWIKLIFRIKS